MKNAIISLILLVASIGANADVIINPEMYTQTANLTLITMDHNFGRPVKRAVIYVNAVKKTASLVLSHPGACAGQGGQVQCLAIAPDTVIELPIVSIGNDGCGGQVITAMRDLRRADGALQQLTIVDHRSATCKTLVAFPGVTEVRLLQVYVDRMQGRVMRLDSSFAGEALHGQYLRR